MHSDDDRFLDLITDRLAGLREVDGILSGQEPVAIVEQAEALLRSAVESGGQRSGM